MPLRPACPGTEIARAPPLTTRARSSRSRVPRGKRSSRPTSSGAQGSRRSGGGLAPARRRAVALPASRVLSLGSALRGAALAFLLCRERHDGLPAEARDSSGPRIPLVTGNGGQRGSNISLENVRGVRCGPACWRERRTAACAGPKPTCRAPQCQEAATYSPHPASLSCRGRPPYSSARSTAPVRTRPEARSSFGARPQAIGLSSRC